MKKLLFIKTLTIALFLLLFSFTFLPSSAQSYTVYECNFDNWTDGKPDGWTFSSPTPNFLTVSQFTPAFSGSYSCKVEGRIDVNMSTTETFPIYWGKKYILSFTAKRTTDIADIADISKFFEVGIVNSGDSISIPMQRWSATYLRKQIEIDNEWKEYEIEFIPQCRENNSVTQEGAPISSLYNGLRIIVSNPKPGTERNLGIIIDNIKLVAKDHTMEFDYLGANNLKAYIDPIVPFKNSPNFSINYFEAPKGSRKSTIYASNLWLGGQDETGEVYVAAHQFCQDGYDFWLGPVTNDYEVIATEEYEGNVVSNAYRQKYHHTWKVSKEEIAYHRAHYADANYVMPWGIANWPAHGRVGYGESAQLAPYNNVSGSSTYEPALGDYPIIRGDEAVFFITNDALDAHTESGSPNNFNLEIMGMAYAFNSLDSALQNTIFLSYKVRNKSTRNFRDFYFGFWADFDIGYAFDDYIGCDTSLNLMYGYNGEEIDGAYGENPPAQGAMFLNQAMSAFVCYNNTPDPKNGNPRAYHHYYNYLRAIWKDGSEITYGGAGTYPESPESPRTSFMFSGDPVTGTGWTEAGAGNAPNDRRGLMSTVPFSLLAGESITVDIALPFARGKNGNLSSVALLKDYAQKIQEFYDDIIVGVVETRTATSLRVYPNPSNGQFTVKSELVIERIEVYDMLGKMVFTSTPKVQTAQINTHLPNGLFIYRAVLEDHSVCSGKIVVQ